MGLSRFFMSNKPLFTKLASVYSKLWKFLVGGGRRHESIEDTLSSRKWIKARTRVYSCFSPGPGVRHMGFCFLGIISYCLDAHERGFANILSSTGVAGMV